VLLAGNYLVKSLLERIFKKLPKSFNRVFQKTKFAL